MNNPDLIPRVRNHFFGLKYLNSLMRIRDGKNCIRDGKKSDPGSGINIPDPPHCFLDQDFIQWLL
jgi:hypothetical protein